MPAAPAPITTTSFFNCDACGEMSLVGLLAFCYSLAPYAGQPGLLLAWKTCRTIVMGKLDETRAGHIVPPAVNIVIHAITPVIPALFVISARIGTEQHPRWFQRCPQFFQYARQLTARNVEQGGIREYAVKVFLRKIEPEEVLLPYLTATMVSRHFDKPRCSFQPDRYMTEIGKRLQIASGAAPQIQYLEGWRTFDVAQQCSNILADIMVFRTLPERLGSFVVTVQCKKGKVPEIRWSGFHDNYK